MKIEMSVYINGKEVPTDNIEDLKKIQSIIDTLISVSSLTAVCDVPVKPLPTHPDTNRIQSRDRSSSPTMNEWVLRAWDELGRPITGATGEQFLEAAKRRGYISTAENPVGAFTASVRQSGLADVVGKMGRQVKWRVRGADDGSEEVINEDEEPIYVPLIDLGIDEDDLDIETLPEV